jgi:hypothetical protein
LSLIGRLFALQHISLGLVRKRFCEERLELPSIPN